MNSSNKTLLILLTLFSLFLYLSAFPDSEDFNGKELIEVEKWKTEFDEYSLDGTFVLYKLNSDSLYVHNHQRAEQPFLPASTFKILNSIISLEAGAVSDENEIIEWDGKRRFYDKWNQNHSMRTAIRYSTVWFYQELARRVGKTKMQYYLKKTEYGNKKIGSDIDKFWLEGDLRISAIEQIIFLNKFLKKELPFSNRNFEIVKSILLVDSLDNSKLYAKTGMTARTDKQIGWYVGFVERETGIWIFAMNIDINEEGDSEQRKGITRRILKQEGIF